MWKQRLLRGGAPRAMDELLVCGADDGGDGGSGGGDDKDDAVKKLTAKLDEVLGEKKKIAEKLRGYEATEAERKADEAKREEEAARKAGDWEKIEKGLRTEVDTAKGEGYRYKALYESLIIDRAMDEAADGAKINPALKKAALALVKAEHSIELSDDGKATIEGKPLADFVGAWAKSDTGKAFVINGSSGGGAGGSGNGGGGGDQPNPFKQGSINLTEQGRLFKTNRAEHDRLKAEAGVR
jgi:hypothetical protein